MMPNSNASDSSSHVYEYWDHMDGNAMVCSEFGPANYRQLCVYNRLVVGAAMLFEAVWLLYNVARLHANNSGDKRPHVSPGLAAVRSTRSTHNSGRIKILDTNKPRKRTQEGPMARQKFWYFRRIALLYGLQFMGLAGTQLINGNGTVYGTSTIIGLVGDSCAILSITAALNLNLLQLRGAAKFRELVTLSIYAGRDPSSSKSCRHHSITILDNFQCWGATLLLLVILVLLANGAATRSTLYLISCLLVASSGLRSLYQNIVDRARTLVRINELQQFAAGDIEAKRRRQGTLKRKARALVYQLVGILVANTILPLSVPLARTNFSSTRVLLHMSAMNTAMVLLIFPQCVVTHKQVHRVFLRRSPEVNKRNTVIQRQGTVADLSGMSVVENSIVGRTPEASRVGLFSELENTEHGSSSSRSTSTNQQ
jgi:hypothetical protein